jgi:hypothetical protein
MFSIVSWNWRSSASAASSQDHLPEKSEPFPDFFKESSISVISLEKYVNL